ncbi:NADP-dependent oxidoreductase [Novosphingobium album (ex Liu et al. 2023)]|uniref:NADP-dependent oxidoreductase n=1 Tax=Novosphingobium album (ex Liu et al. 2023) TaxID=3031130 RepID=A0ABT5WVQ7_9SPHN|nr:NADP-dependent oxidoreductase [Novosphingobium album (ex Liu et al. 2023)]MDE8654000.1 NADP-dependent oxidoreductase [Novosphingobium album (ex Liu et al. 2023)]
MAGMMRQVVLAAYARGNPRPSDFRIEQVPIPEAGEREILLKTLWLALDPLIRFSIDEKLLSGATHMQLGEVMFGPTVSEVVASNHPDYAVGDFVEGRTGWREYAIVAPDRSDYRGPPRKLDPGLAPVSTALGALGGPGQTAHEGIVTVGRVKPGETVVISAAAGAVGSIAGQIAKVLGARAVGIAGGPDKCRALRDLGFDAAVDYKAADFADQFKAALPDGADVYLDNVGGDVTLAVLPLLNRGARMPMCGYIAYYGVGMEGPGPDHLPGFYRHIMAKGLEIKGFAGIFAGQKGLDDIAGWMKQGKIRFPEAVVEGLEAAPEAFASVFSGNAHVGKLLVRVADKA